MIGEALWAVAIYVDDNATGTSWDQHQHLSDERRLSRAEKIRAVAVELRALAEAAGVRTVRYGEFEALKDCLYAFGLPLPLDLSQRVAAAFHSAKGPGRPRAKGWLKPS